MKKLVSVILLLCLALACVPAGAADSPAGRGGAGEYTLDLSSGDVNITDTTVGELLYNTTVYASRQNLTGRISESVLESMYQKYGYLCPEDCYMDFDDLDGNGSVDIIELSRNEGYFYADFRIVAAEECSIADKWVLEPVPDSERDIYSPLTIVFAKPEAELPVSYTDETGIYTIAGREASYEKSARTSLTSAKIPDTITVEGAIVPVTKIGPSAFRGNQKKLTKVTIGKNVKEIGMNAFYGCAKLKTVSGGANVEIIGGCAFQGCKALTKITIGAKVKEIGNKAFYKCSALKKITIKTKLLTGDTVGKNAFKGICKTATVKVPKAVKKEYSKWLLKKGVKKTMKIK